MLSDAEHAELTARYAALDILWREAWYDWACDPTPYPQPTTFDVPFVDKVRDRDRDADILDL